MSGWICFWRSLLNHPLWTRARFTPGQAWVDLLLSAAHTDHLVPIGTTMVEECRGQLVTSQVKLAARWGWDRETVRRFFRTLERGTMCHIRTSKDTESGYTLVTILNYERFQWDAHQSLLEDPASDAPSDAPSNPASVPHPCPTPNNGNKGNKQKEASGLTLAQYLGRLAPEDQEVIRQTVQAIASTRKSGKVAQSVLDSLAKRLDGYPQPVVLQACRTYLAKDYASQGKGEAYLLGIVRGEARRQNGNGREPSSPFVGQEGKAPTPVTPAPKTEGQLAIDRALAEKRREWEAEGKL